MALPLMDESKRYERISRNRISFLDQLTVGQPPAADAIHKRIEALRRVPAHIAVIQAEREFVDVPARVLRADVVERANNPALEHGPNRFDSVCRNIAVDVQLDVLARRMVYGFVPEEKTVHPRVGTCLVRVECRSRCNSCMDDRLQRTRFRVADWHQDRFSESLLCLNFQPAN